VNENLAARCGIYCGECEYREEFNCSGCIDNEGEIFWGECDVAKCCIQKGLEHCGKCEDFVCDCLHDYAFSESEGDDGKRIEELKERNKEGTKN